MLVEEAIQENIATVACAVLMRLTRRFRPLHHRDSTIAPDFSQFSPTRLARQSKEARDKRGTVDGRVHQAPHSCMRSCCICPLYAALACRSSRLGVMLRWSWTSSQQVTDTKFSHKTSRCRFQPISFAVFATHCCETHFNTFVYSHDDVPKGRPQPAILLRSATIKVEQHGYIAHNGTSIDRITRP